MGWQADIFAKLRDREWHLAGDLYQEVETRIPLHIAMRHAMRRTKRQGSEELPANSTARWELFIGTLAHIGVETDGRPRGRKWTDHVRLRYVRDRVCEHCGGPVIKASWQARSKVKCLACEAPPKPIPEPVPAPMPVPAPPPPQAPPLQLQELYQRQKAFATFLKMVRLPFLSVSGILKRLGRWRGDLNGLLGSFGQRPLAQAELILWLKHQTHPP